MLICQVQSIAWVFTLGFATEVFPLVVGSPDFCILSIDPNFIRSVQGRRQRCPSTNTRLHCSSNTSGRLILWNLSQIVVHHGLLLGNQVLLRIWIFHRYLSSSAFLACLVGLVQWERDGGRHWHSGCIVQVSLSLVHASLIDALVKMLGHRHLSNAACFFVSWKLKRGQLLLRTDYKRLFASIFRG